MFGSYVYKICTQTEWQAAQREGLLTGNSDDKRDGFVHLSTLAQLRGTLQKHFAAQGDLVLLEVKRRPLKAKLEWEGKPSGPLFPHLYGPLDVKHVRKAWPLDAAHTLPRALCHDGNATWGSERSAAALAVATGLLYFLAFPGIDIWPLSFITWVPLLLALRGRSVRHATFLAWISGFTMTFVGFYWLLGMLQKFSGFGVPLCLLFMVLLACYQGGRIGLFGYLYARSASLGWPRGVCFALAFAVSEFLYPLLFPWYFGATVHQVSLLTQLAELGNPILVGLVCCGVNYAVAELFVAYREKRALPWKLAGAQLALLLAAVAYGAVRLRAVDAAMASAPKGQVGLVQANMGLMAKRLDRQEGLRRHVELSLGLEKAGPLDLIVWPETSVAGAVYEREAEASYRQLFTERLQSPTLFGAALARPVKDARRYALLNAALLSEQGRITGSYAKHKLLAFGEYLPLGETFPILYEWSPNTGMFTQGDSLDPLPAGTHRVSAHICYEDVLPSFVNEMIRGSNADLIVNMTNDAWYGDTTQPWIHLALASFRAIEHRRYLVRATNSGVSAFVDAAGRVVSHTGTFEAAALSHEVAYLAGATPYELYGDLPWWLCSAAIGIFCLKRRSTSTPPARAV